MRALSSINYPNLLRVTSGGGGGSWRGDEDESETIDILVSNLGPSSRASGTDLI